jgi:hypothetical protein
MQIEETRKKYPSILPSVQGLTGAPRRIGMSLNYDGFVSSQKDMDNIIANLQSRRAKVYAIIALLETYGFDTSQARIYHSRLNTAISHLESLSKPNPPLPKIEVNEITEEEIRDIFEPLKREKRLLQNENGMGAAKFREWLWGRWPINSRGNKF